MSMRIDDDGDVEFLVKGKRVFVSRGVMHDLCGTDRPTREQIEKAFLMHEQQFVLIGTATSTIDVNVARKYGLTR